MRRILDAVTRVVLSSGWRMRMFGEPWRSKRWLARGCVWVAALCVCASAFKVNAFGDVGLVDLRVLVVGDGHDPPRPSAAQRLAWEVHKRTSVEMRLRPSRVRLDEPALLDSPFAYWSEESELAPLSEAEVLGLRRFVELGGFLLIDDASGETTDFDRSVRRELARALPRDALAPLPDNHVVFRSFYLVRRPAGRLSTPPKLEAITRGDRVAVLYSRHDLGGAWDRSDAGQYRFPLLAGGERQREEAYRFGVNIVMYALCLDYKDDQVHAPFIMRRQAFVR